jgi:hypothetical protein
VRFFFAGLVASIALVVGAPAAQASDASLKSTVVVQQQKLDKAAEHYQQAVKNLKTDAQIAKAKSETQTLVTVTQTYHDAVKGQQADSAKYKSARLKLLDALSTYKRGLNTFIEALDAKSDSKAASALKTIVSSGSKFRAAAKAFS